ncbi:MAG: carbohydrate ABC transporter permease [Spirochaetaceae bacterium]|nr:carbohydrate ABC transporter permease [Spirochaetaceae bacterium]
MGMGLRPRDAPAVARHAFLVLASAVYLVPFYIAVVNAFKTRADIFGNPLGIPFARLTLDNLARNLNTPYFNVGVAYGTSVVLSGLTVVFVVLLGAAMSYVISRHRQRMFTFAYLLLLAGLMVPAQVILLPLVQVLRHLRLMFTLPGLLLANLAGFMPFAVFVFVGYIRTIPTQIDESARLDGAGEVLIFRRIIYPLIGPAVASVVIFVALWTWNDFVNPLIILGTSKYYTITIGVYRAIGQYVQKWEDVFAIVLMAIFPVAVFYLFMQRRFVSGLTAGTLKG